MPRESAYQSRLINKLRGLFPGCYITKSDPSQNQGIPDILILFGDRWAMLEVKRSEKELGDLRPNQQYWVDHFNGWSFAAFIYPENEDEIIDALQSTFGTRRKARVS